MFHDKRYDLEGRGYSENSLMKNGLRTMYWGVVVSNVDNEDGAKLKVRIPGLDNKFSDAELPFSYPFMPRFLHIIPKEGEMVRIFIEDAMYPNRSRFWTGPVISQQQNISYDDPYTAMSTTNISISKPKTSHTEIVSAKGIYPEKDDIAILGRLNNDIILRDNQVLIRAGKHMPDNNLERNTKNQTSINLIFESTENGYRSSSITVGDKIALIATNGNPKTNISDLTKDDRDIIFEKGHPIARGDEVEKILRIVINAIKNHVHGYHNMPADPDAIIKSLETINLNDIYNSNILIN